MLFLKISFTIILIFSVLFSAAQLKFDSDGRVTKLESNLTALPDMSELVKPANELKQEVRELLLEKVEETLRIITRNNYKKSLHLLHMFLWKGDSSNIVNYLNAVKNSLLTDRTSAIGGLLGVTFNRAFNNNLSSAAQVFTWTPPGQGHNSGTLWKLDPFKSFLIDYHNLTLADLSARKEDVVEGEYYLIEKKLATDSLLKRYREHLIVGSFSHPLYDSLKLFHELLDQPTSELKKIRTLLQGDWFKQWFWITGGSLRFNPLHLSVRALLDNIPSYDLIKQFNPIQQQQSEFFLEKRIEKLTDSFASAKDTLTITRKLINQVSLPQRSGYFNFTASGNVKFPFSETDLTATVHAGKNKLVGVHNIQGNRRLRLSENSKSFADKSAFQVGFDDVISQLGDLAAAYARITPYSAMLDLFLPKANYNNNSIKFPTLQQVEKSRFGAINDYNFKITEKKSNKLWKAVDPLNLDTITVLFDALSLADSKADILEIEVQQFILRGHPNDLLKDLLLDILLTKNLYDAQLFQSFATDQTSLKDATEILNFNRKLGDYLSLLMKAQAERVKVDSSIIMALLRVYNESSAPFHRILVSKDDKRPNFYSDSLETTASDTAAEITVRPYTVDTAIRTDTAFITQFGYKVSKSKRFTLSAGIAYTLNSYDQSIAKQENGTIKITNVNRLARLVVGLNYYFGDGLFSQDNSFWGRNWERMYAFVGVGIPSPLENLYFGVGRDLFPGLKLTIGAHIAKHNKYFIQNNEIIEERLRYEPAGPFVALKVDPTSLIKLFDVFKKK